MASDSNIGSWVPQLFYDLIARVIPGFGICVSFLLFFEISNPITINYKEIFLSANCPTTFIILAGISISYICGFVFRGIYCLICFIAGITTDIKDEYVLYYDRIKLENESAGSRLSKLRAEIHMCTVLETGWFCSFMFFMLKALETNFLDKKYSFTYVPLILLILATIGNHCRLLQRFYQETDNYITEKWLPSNERED